MIREARGLGPGNLAKELGINTNWYFDLEADRPSWPDEISIRVFRQLARELDISPSALLSESERLVPTAQAFVDALTNHLATSGMLPEVMADKIGWDVERLIAAPALVADLHAEGFKAICDEIGLDWRLVLDEMKL